MASQRHRLMVAAAPAGAGTDVDVEVLQQRLGARLRQVRKARGLTLRDVEDRTEGRWKAVVVGSYERGDRAVSAVRLADLAEFYGVAVTDLLDDGTGRRQGSLGDLVLDADRIESERPGDLAPLARLVAHVRWERGDHRSQRLQVRHDDLVAVAVAAGLAPEGLAEWLAERGVVADPR